MRIVPIGIFVLCMPYVVHAATTAWDINIFSSKDGSTQLAMFWVPSQSCISGGEPVPLLVALHTWQGTYKQDNGLLAEASKTWLGGDIATLSRTQ